MSPLLYLHQDYLDKNPTIGRDQRIKWCQQAVEAVAYIHSRGILHCDLRPGNLLVDETCEGSLELRLCDFGGSVCESLQLNGKALPSIPFYDPALGFDASAILDIFSLGSVIYTILTSRWPFRDLPGRPSTSSGWSGCRSSGSASTAATTTRSGSGL